jgi:hypothetical protein
MKYKMRENSLWGKVPIQVSPLQVMPFSSVGCKFFSDRRGNPCFSILITMKTINPSHEIILSHFVSICGKESPVIVMMVKITVESMQYIVHLNKSMLPQEDFDLSFYLECILQGE